MRFVLMIPKLSRGVKLKLTMGFWLPGRLGTGAIPINSWLRANSAPEGLRGRDRFEHWKSGFDPRLRHEKHLGLGFEFHCEVSQHFGALMKACDHIAHSDKSGLTNARVTCGLKVVEENSRVHPLLGEIDVFPAIGRKNRHLETFGVGDR